MFLTILHNAVAADAPPEERDVLVQVEIVRAALAELGHETSIVPCNLDLESLRKDLGKLQPAVVFNLVESLGGCDRLANLAPALLEALCIPFTGSTAEGLALTNHKLLTKQHLAAVGLPTPRWVSIESEWDSPASGALAEAYIIKAVGEHASLGIDDDSVVRGLDRPALLARLAESSARLGMPCFAEEFIVGREFNISLLAGNGGPTVLPPAEIDFSTFPAGKPKIVGYRAKWDEAAPEFRGTPRTFEFPPADRPLLDELAELALRTWRLFHLRGWVRVDFRVDSLGRPWILEANANPCLSPDAGYFAALTRANISFTAAVERIVASALESRH